MPSRREKLISIGRAASVCAALLLLPIATSTPAASARPAVTQSTIYRWPGSPANPGHSRSGLVADASGFLYGAAAGNSVYPPGLQSDYGSVFRLVPPTGSHTNWTESTLYAFKGGTDGNTPIGGIVIGHDGALYGTTRFGGNGVNLRGGMPGYGVVFRLIPPPGGVGPWTEQVLHAFTAQDTMYPNAELLPGPNGEFYGTTQGAGCSAPAGTVFGLYPPSKPGGSWQEVTLFTFEVEFCPGGARPRVGALRKPTSSTGAVPSGGLIADASGNLYGTAAANGLGFGLVFELVRSANPPWTENVIHYFSGPDGSYPYSTLYAASDGKLYGTAETGGANYEQNGGNGVVFALAPPAAPGGSWQQSVIYSFSGPDGSVPVAGVTGDASGALYGSTRWGGKKYAFTQKRGVANGHGVVFKLTPNGSAWNETTLHLFNSGTLPMDGQNPNGVLEDASGALYGTTLNGGYAGAGTAFRITQ